MSGQPPSQRSKARRNTLPGGSFSSLQLQGDGGLPAILFSAHQVHTAGIAKVHLPKRPRPTGMDRGGKDRSQGSEGLPRGILPPISCSSQVEGSSRSQREWQSGREQRGWEGHRVAECADSVSTSVFRLLK